MKRTLLLLKNKYVLSTVCVVLYILIVHETDIIALVNKNRKIAALEATIVQKRENIKELKESLKQLDDPKAVEKYAREHHFFKKEDEDIFVLSSE